MNGFIRKAAAVGCCAAGLLTTVGCTQTYNELVDPCWPQRYNAIAREEVSEPLAIQADNGLILEQTMWNYHFRQGTDQLTPGGQALLSRLARRRPAPVPQIFLQTAHEPDISYIPGKPEQFATDRTELDQKRIKAVTDYLKAEQPGVSFNVMVHNPTPVGMHSTEASASVRQTQNTAQGVSTGAPRLQSGASSGAAPAQKDSGSGK